MAVIYRDNTAQMQSALDTAIARALEICGGKAESYAKEICPVDTGNLRNSITHAMKDEHTVMIGTSVEYAPYVELGHHQEPGRYVPAIKKRLKKEWVPPKPYLRPALENHMQEYAEVITRETANAVK